MGDRTDQDLIFTKFLLIIIFIVAKIKHIKLKKIIF